MPEAEKRDDLPGLLKEARKALGLSQRELAKQAEIPLPSVKDHEVGKSMPGGDALAGYAKVGINVHRLVTGTGPVIFEGAAREGHELLIRDVMLKDPQAHAIREERMSYTAERLAPAQRAVDRLVETVGDPGEQWKGLLTMLLIYEGLSEHGVQLLLEQIKTDVRRGKNRPETK